MTKRVLFLVDQDKTSGYTARAVGVSIFTEAESLEELRVNIRQAVRCHYGRNRPVTIQLTMS